MFACYKCVTSFSQRSDLKRHLRVVHREFKRRKITVFQCRACLKKFYTNDNFCRHLKETHRFVFRSENYHFNTQSDFAEWMDLYEKEGKGEFIVRNAKGSETHYRCFRSGAYRPKGSPGFWERRWRELESDKTTFHCPAAITALVLPDDSVDVTLNLPHFGHDVPVQLLPKRKSLPVQGGIPSSCLHFGVNNECHFDDEYSVGAWAISERGRGADGCVLLYKPRGESCREYPQLKRGDFCLVIMTLEQKRALKRFGKDLICLGSSHGSSTYPVTTLTVVRDKREGFPCAYFISDRTDRTGLELFLLKIREQVGDINPGVLLTDTTHDFRTAWNSVMSGCSKHLYCPWHVLRRWEENINLEIKNKSKKEETLKHLKSLMKEGELPPFLSTLSSMLGRLLADQDTRAFGEYFRCFSWNLTKKWAYCYNLEADIHTNPNLERLHEEFFSLEKTKRLDVTIHALIRFSNQKLSRKLEKSKIRQIESSHQLANSLDVSQVYKMSGDTWVVMSDPMKLYVLFLLGSDQRCNCNLVCQACDTCIHKYVCTCEDCSAHFNMCEHIHLLCTFLKERGPTESLISPSQSPPSAVEEPIIIDDNKAMPTSLEESNVNINFHLLKSTLNLALRQNPTTRNMTAMKDEIGRYVQSMLNDCSALEDLDFVNEGLRRIGLTTEALRRNKLKLKS